MVKKENRYKHILKEKSSIELIVIFKNFNKGDKKMNPYYIIFSLVLATVLTVTSIIVYNKVSLNLKKRKENRSRTCKW